MPITEAIQEIILTHGTTLQIVEQARRDGVMLLRESGLQKVERGSTSLEEVLATANQWPSRSIVPIPGGRNQPWPHEHPPRTVRPQRPIA